MSDSMNRDPDFVIDSKGRLCHTPQPFDENDDDLMHDVCGERLAKPVQGLLLTLAQIEKTMGSFGLDDRIAMKALLPDLRALRDACKETWEDM